MKPIALFTCVASLVCLQSCGESIIKNKTEDAAQHSPETADTGTKISAPKSTGNLIIKDEKDLIGYWVGKFEPDTAVNGVPVGDRLAWDYSNKINLSIDGIENGKVVGHSVVAGNNRPFAGIVENDKSTFQFSVSEPGDDKYDGKFKFEISQSDSILTGTWTAYGKIKIRSRRYTLTKKIFRYNPGWHLEAGRYVDWNKMKSKFVKDDELGNGYDITYFTTTEEVNKYNASVDTLTREMAANMKKADLFILRNAIYARHGFSFKNQQLRAYFDRQPWYIPISTDIKNELTPLEKQNIALLLRFEKNAKEYYDAFGRG